MVYQTQYGYLIDYFVTLILFCDPYALRYIQVNAGGPCWHFGLII